MLADIANAPATVNPVPFFHAFHVGGISFSIHGNYRQGIHLGDSLVPFCASSLPSTKSHIEVAVEWGGSLRAQTGTHTFDSGAVWRLTEHSDGLCFDFFSPAIGQHPYKRLIVDPEFRNATVILSREALDGHDVRPLEYPTDELLITNHLAFHSLGAEVHGCGLIDREAGGQLFLGHSGAGKSTTARVWEHFRNPQILSDDRIILRLHHGELFMYGTPWHGEAEFAAPARAPLSRIFILKHGRRNVITPIPKARAVGELFARSFPPFHSPVGLSRTLEFLNRVLDGAPCYELEFIPDRTVVDTVLSFHD